MPGMNGNLSDLINPLSAQEQDFLGRVCRAMEEYFAGDGRRIAHAHAVAGHAHALLAYVEADPLLTLTVAYLHDIGIHEAERRHGSNAGNFQELEGPPIARRLLAGLQAPDELVECTAVIVGRHHTRNGVDAAEFRILWDADALVNFSEVLPGKSSAAIESMLRRHMVTEAGYRMARRLYLSAADAGPGPASADDFPG
jgi:hypothetical protein